MLKYLTIAFLFFTSCKYALPAKESFVKKSNIEIDTEKIKVNLQIDSIKTIASEGEIIFRGGTDIESSIIRNFSNDDKLFSHCGILLKDSNQLNVTHILGGVTNPKGSILQQPIQEFLTYPNNESAGLYSFNLSAAELKRLHFFIDSIKKQKVTFDLHFNLFTKQELYCTEMVIDALQYAKAETNLFIPTTYHLKNTKYFFLNNKGDDFLFYPIDVFQHNSFLHLKSIFYFPNYKNEK